MTPVRTSIRFSFTSVLPCLAAIGVVALPLAPAAAQGRVPTLADYYRLEFVGSPAISPNGGRVAYVRTQVLEQENRRHNAIWLAASEEGAEAVRITDSTFDATSPRWSPDGRLVAFSATRVGDDSAERGVWFVDVERGGDPFRVDRLIGTPVFGPLGERIAFRAPVPPTPAPDKVYASDFERQIDERFDGRMYDWMGYRFDRRGYLKDPRDPQATPPHEIFVMPARGGEPEQLTELGVDAQGLHWRSDGTALTFTADSHQRDEYSYERADIWTVSLAGDMQRLTDDAFHYSNPAWSPDGRFIAVQGRQGLDRVIATRQSHGAPTDIYVLPAEGGELRNVTDSWDLIPGAPTWSGDGQHLFFSAGVGGDIHLFRVPAAGGDVEQVTSGQRRLRGLSFSADASAMAFQVSTPTHPGDIHTASVDASRERRVTATNEEWLSARDLVGAQQVLFPSADETQIEGWLMPPVRYDANGGPYPLILSIHGGPHSAYGHDFSLHRQLLAAEGFFVLYINPRGSTGYGEAFRWATWGGWGILDYEDLMAGVDYVVERYPVDVDRMGVTGGSYGGFMTNWVIGHTERFAAAVARASISNWVSDYGVADIPRTKESEFFGTPWEAESRDLMMKLSPITYAGNVSTPTLFLHGELDHRVPIEEAEQMYTALKKRSVPAAFIRYPDSYHGGWTPWRQVHAYHYELEWWRRYLLREQLN